MSVIFHKGYWIVLALVIVLSAGYAYYRDLPGRYRYLEETEQKVESLTQELEASQAREQDLTDQVESAHDDIKQEDHLRSQGLVREGEKLIEIRTEEPEAGADGP